jgi:hypothetical protein
VNAIVDQLSKTGNTCWDDVVKNDNFTDLLTASSEAKGDAANLAFIGDYLTYRCMNPRSENCHNNAMTYAQNRRGPVRRALGYSYP